MDSRYKNPTGENLEELDKYSVGASGVGSLGVGFSTGVASGGSGLVRLPDNHHEEAIKRAKAWMSKKQVNK